MQFWERWAIPPNMCVKNVLCCILHSYLTMNRAILRPSAQDEDVFQFILGGPDVDLDKTSASREEFIKAFYSFTKRTDILFGDLVWISQYRSEQA